MDKRVPVVTEDDDSDIISLKVECHTPNTRSELDHLSGLDLVQAHHSGNTVTDADHCPELFHIILSRSSLTTWLIFIILSWITLAVSAIPSFFEVNPL